MRHVVLALAALPALFSARSLAAKSYQYSEPAALAGGLFHPTGINDGGEVVGTSEVLTNPDQLIYTETGFVYRNGSLSEVTVLNAPLGTSLQGVNRSGRIAGFVESGGTITGFVLAGNSVRTITAPDGTPATPTGLNTKGEVVGWYTKHLTDTQDVVFGFVQGTGRFLRLAVPGATSTLPSGINDAGVVVGTYVDKTGSHGFTYADGSYATVDVPGSAFGSTNVNGLNNTGQIVGSFVDGAYVARHGFVERNGRFQTLDAPGGEQGSEATGINDRGVIVGDYQRSDGEGVAGIVISGYIATPQR